jgi:hypothetical protein
VCFTSCDRRQRRFKLELRLEEMATASVEYVELSVFATGLQNVAGLLHGTSDPFAVITQVPSNDDANSKPVLVGRTET